MSNYRLLSYQENEKEKQESEKLYKQINEFKQISQKFENKTTKSNAIYRISPILTKDKNNISYPTLIVPNSQNELTEVIEKISKEDFNDINNKLFVSKIIDEEKDIDKNEENKENFYEIKVQDEEDINPRAPLDRHNFVRSFCITMDTYKDRVEFDDEDEENPDIIVESLEEKLNNLFDI